MPLFRLFVVIAIFLTQSSFLYSIETKLGLLLKIPITNKGSQLVYSADPSDGISPRALQFITGRNMLIAQTKNALIYDIKMNAIDGQISFPLPDSNAAYRNSFFFGVSDKFILAIKRNPTAFFLDSTTLSIHSNKSFPSINSQLIKPYLINDVFFIYCEDSLVRAITREGSYLDQDAVTRLLLGWHNTTWYASPKLKEIHTRLIKTGKYLIADGIFYPSIASQARDYFDEINVSWIGSELMKDETKLATNAFFYGVSHLGDLYLGSSSGIHVFNNAGTDLAIISTREANRYFSATDEERENRIGNLLYAIHPNGDVYGLQAVDKEGFYFYKQAKSWGVDYIAIAKNGLPDGSDPILEGKLRAMSSRELRIIRNALMALHGYAFLSKELSDYFLGYEWYSPDPTIKNDATILSTAQRRLFDVVSSIEKERLLAP